MALSTSSAESLAILTIASLALPIHAGVFLGYVPAHAGVSEADLKLERDLLSQIEDVLGSEHRMFTEKRLASIKSSLSPIFAAVPKNEHGNLGHAAVSYALYRLFVQRHAWFVFGLEPFKTHAEWNATSATQVLEARVPEYITGLFNTRMGEHGFDLHHIAVLAATLEHLVHKESLLRLSAAYISLNLSREDVLTVEEGHDVMDTYMAMYLLGPLIRNLSNVSSQWVRFLRANVTSLYPGFVQTQQFLREVSDTVAPARDHLYYSDVASLVEEVSDRHGRWQDYECHALKNLLVEMEDQSTGGAGRVRLAEFYRAALYNGKWQLSENIEYLRKLGALDESNPDNLRVIIPNYVNGPSNCVASSSYYSVCCINECEEILGHLELNIAASDASPDHIAKLIALLPSTTLAGQRTLSPWLLRRLHDVAAHHAGLVPLHGRLFSQWLHYAYPRECPYPHVSGATSPQTAHQFVSENRRDFAANATEMRRIIEMPVPHQRRSDETGDIEELCQLESAMWTMDEELVVVRPSSQSSGMQSWAAFCLRGVVFVGAVVSVVISLTRRVNHKLPSGMHGAEKYYV